MFEGKYAKFLTGALITGIIVIVGGIAFFGFTFIRNYYINKDAEDAVARFEGEVVNNKENDKKENIITNEVVPTLGIDDLFTNNGFTDESEKMYKGFPMVGTIEIPAINLKYPVLKEAGNAEIKVAVGIYDGPGLNQVGNTTIAGHNYRNGTFFSNNKKLVNGDKIYITDNSGTKIGYTIYNIYTTSPEDWEYLDRDTAGKREISLTTCTDDSKSRLIIWAKEE